MHKRTIAIASSSSPMTTETATTDAMASGQFGAACSQVPTDPSNPGSFDAMAKVPVATAASGNPILSTLVTAVKKAGLVDTLNSAQHILTGSLTTLQGSAVKAEGTAPNITVAPTGTQAHVICGNIQTANATAYIVDSVMMPTS